MNHIYRILVVDDDTDVANATARLLEQAGYSVERVYTGEDAWRIANDLTPDLVLLDRELPDIDGLEVCRRIKRTPALAGSVVVLASASHVDSETLAEGLEEGADGYIARPVANRELLARVSAFVRMLSLSRTLKVQSDSWRAAKESTQQTQMATLNLLEDALEAQQSAERAQLALERSTRMLEVTGSIAKIGGWELDVATSKLTWTRETFKIHGLEPPEPDLEKALDAYTPEARAVVATAVKAAMDFGMPFDLELPFVARDGRLLWVNARGQAEMRHGNAVRLYGSFQDITARRKAQLALIASEARARALIDSTPVPMAVKDRAERITFINEAFTLAFGYSLEDIPTIDDWWPKAYPDPDYRLSVMTAWQKEIARVQRSGDAFRPIEVQLRSKDGTLRNVLASVSSFSADAEGSSMVTLLDITDRKRMERQVLQSEKLASIGLLAAGVAHEINNPIGFVNSNLGSLGRLMADLLAVIDAFEDVQASQTSPSEQWTGVDAVKVRVELDYLRKDLPSLLAECEEGLQRVKRIVKSLKEFAYTSAVDRWQPDDLIQGLESTLNVVWNELKYTCEVRREFVELPLVDCVLSQINQVFMNLLINAAQAIEGKGVITLRSGCGGGEVWVEIADDGRGISAEEQLHIFDPFFTTKEIGKGTGLGLSVSHGIIERHHGRIEVQSEMGKGTTMRVCLPVRQPANA